MHVTIYAHYQPPSPSASATRMLSLANHLSNGGHTVTFLTSQPGPANAYGFNVTRAKGRMGLLKALARGPRDVIFVSSPPATPAAEVAFAARLLGYRVLVDIRDPYIIEALKNNEVRPGLKTKIKGALEWSLPRSAHCMSFVSKYLQSEFESFSGHSHSNTVIAPNGADLETFRFSSALRENARRSLGLEDEALFCYAGILGGKDLDKTVDALAPALRDGAKLLLVGIVDEYSLKIKEEIVAQFARLGLSSQLLWKENLAVSELATLLPGADIGLNPLPGHRAYCLPVKTYEYMACGVYNLAHGGQGSAMLAQLNPLVGTGCSSWEDFSHQAVRLTSAVAELRGHIDERVELAQAYGRFNSNVTLCTALEHLSQTNRGGATAPR